MQLPDKTADHRAHRPDEVSQRIMKITDEVFTEFLHCKYKAYLMLTGVLRELSDCEKWLRRPEEEYVAAATRALLDREDAGFIPDKMPITKEAFTQGITTVIDTHVEDESFMFAFHALQRTPGASSLGSFYYVPVLFCGTGQSVSEPRKLLLAYGTLVLERFQHVRPPGIVICGDAYRSHSVDLEAQQLKALKIVDDLTDYHRGHKTPRLCLNNHCHVCRYEQQCKAEAKRLDDLSLLNRMSEREIQLYNRKGIFTVQQLSYTFRFRKRAKRVKTRGRPHSFPLQALAIREQSVFVASRPAVPETSTHIYVDMEGSPSGSFIYLIGVLVVENGSTRHHSFWADSKDDEEHLFAQFLRCLSRFGNARLFYYGSYETHVFRRILDSASTDKIK